MDDDTNILYEAGRYSDGSPMYDRFNSGQIPPEWMHDALNLENDIRLAGSRISRFRLTPAQMRDVQHYLGTDADRLLGHPFVARRR